MVEATGFDGPVEVETFSRDRWWREDPDVVLRLSRAPADGLLKDHA